MLCKEPRLNQSKICAACGEEFFRKHGHSIRQWESIKCCSRKCASSLRKDIVMQARPIKNCPTCKKDFKSQNGVYCSLPCYYAVRDIPVVKCLTCGVEFKKPGRRQKYCSERCSQIGSRGAKPERYKDKIIDGQGYVLVRIPDDSPFIVLRNKNGYVREHRLVLSQKIGRPLFPHEQPHHKDGVRSNNAEDNLELRVGSHGLGSTVHCPTCTCNEKKKVMITTEYLKDFNFN